MFIAVEKNALPYGHITNVFGRYVHLRHDTKLYQIIPNTTNQPNEYIKQGITLGSYYEMLASFSLY